MLKKSSIFLIPHTGIYSTTNPINASSSSLNLNQPRCRPKPRERQFHTSPRIHDVVAKGYSKHHHNAELRWPEVTSANAVPTPYQIFNQRKGAPYSKRRFYELVKLYHPDRNGLEASSDGLPHETKLERYRLVVAANDILSDPVKRGAYDIYGAGWNGQPSVKTAAERAQTGDWGWQSSGGRGWGSNPNGPSQNATWEDWEAWRNPKSRQRPVYASNSTFVALTVLFVALGLTGQAMRADGHSKRYLEQRDALHVEMSKDLMKRRRETREDVGSSQERIFRFLRLRNEGLVGTEMEHKMLMQQNGTGAEGALMVEEGIPEQKKAPKWTNRQTSDRDGTTRRE